MSKRKVSVADKIYAVNLYLDGKESQRRIADMFDVSLASVQQWIRNYESMGANAFTLKGNKKYSKELKQQAVVDYLAGYGLSLIHIYHPMVPDLVQVCRTADNHRHNYYWLQNHCCCDHLLLCSRQIPVLQQ